MACAAAPRGNAPTAVAAMSTATPRALLPDVAPTCHLVTAESSLVQAPGVDAPRTRTYHRTAQRGRTGAAGAARGWRVGDTKHHRMFAPPGRGVVRRDRHRD